MVDEAPIDAVVMPERPRRHGERIAIRHPRTRSGARVLVIGAHPDDVELGCGATLARLTALGATVHALIATCGGNGGRADLRRSEAHAAAAFLGIEQVTVHDLPDTELPDHERELGDLIEHSIASLEPGVVLTHSANDHHQDHVAAHRATLRAARGLGSILCYESPSVSREFDPSVFVDVEGYMERKVDAIRLHRGQLAKAYMDDTVTLCRAGFRGQQARAQVAEAFEPVRYRTDSLGLGL